MQKKKDPLFLVKFCRELEHANILLRGCLFMRPAASYHKIENEFCDIREAAVFEGKMFYKNPNSFIYCMTFIPKENGEYVLNRMLFKRFECETGYLVIIKYKEFISVLEKEETKKTTFNNYSYSFGPVNYQKRDLDFAKKALLDKHFDSTLFIKSPCFSCEREFRIATSEQFDGYPVDECGVLDGEFDIKNVYKNFYLPETLNKIAIIVPIPFIKDKIIFNNETIIIKDF